MSKWFKAGIYSLLHFATTYRKYCVEYEGKGDSVINESTYPNTVPSLPHPS